MTEYDIEGTMISGKDKNLRFELDTTSLGVIDEATCKIVIDGTTLTKTKTGGQITIENDAVVVAMVAADTSSLQHSTEAKIQCDLEVNGAGEDSIGRGTLKIIKSL